MIIKELNDLYGRLIEDPDVGEEKVPPQHFSSENVGFVLEIDESGVLCDASFFVDADGSSKPTTRAMGVPEHVGRSSGILPFFLCDSPAYLLGFVDTSKMDDEDAAKALEKAGKRREASADLHRRIFEGCDDSASEAVLLFFANPHPLDSVSNDVLDVLREAKGFGVFRLKGARGYIHELFSVREAWSSYCGRPSGNENFGQCSVTGRKETLARLFPQVSGIPGAQSAGASLVSFNCESFTSYGKEQAYNASISQRVATNAGVSLKYLYRDRAHHVMFGDTMVLLWSDRPAPRELETVFAMLDGTPGEDEQQNARIQNALMNMRAGRPLGNLDLSTRFYILGLSPNAARLSVRFYYTNTLEELTRHYGDYLRDVEMVGCRTTSLFRLMRQTALLDDEKNIPQTLVHACASAMLEGAQFPRMLYTAVLARMRTDHGDRKPWDRGERAALLKGYLVRQMRHRRLLGQSIDNESEITMSLDETNSDEGYVLGRLFALIENVQSGAQGSVGASVADRYIGAASTTPARCFPNLFRNLQNNMSKLHKTKPGLAVIREKELEETFGLLDGSRPLPTTLDEEAQGRFFIGYYQQREKFYQKKTDNVETTDDEQFETALDEEE